MSGREVEEGQKLIRVLDQLGCRPLLFYFMGLDEAIECRFGLFPGFCHPNAMKVRLALLTNDSGIAPVTLAALCTQ